MNLHMLFSQLLCLNSLSFHTNMTPQAPLLFLSLPIRFVHIPNKTNLLYQPIGFKIDKVFGSDLLIRSKAYGQRCSYGVGTSRETLCGKPVDVGALVAIPVTNSNHLVTYASPYSKSSVRRS